MGRLQQITIAAAQAAHEVRRVITDITGGGQTPAFGALDHDLRNQAIEHASHVLSSTVEPSNMLDEIIWLTAEEIRMLDGEAEDAATVEQINARIPEYIAIAPDPMKETK